MRLGSMNGADSGYGMWLTSCTLNTDSLVAEANHQWLQQQFGYHNSPEIKDDQPAWFARYVHSGWTNRSAWLDQMEDRPGWFTGDNSPIVVTYGQNEADCNNLAQTLSLGNSVAPRGGGPSCGQGQPYFWYCGTLLNNGGC